MPFSTAPAVPDNQQVKQYNTQNKTKCLCVPINVHFTFLTHLKKSLQPLFKLKSCILLKRSFVQQTSSHIFRSSWSFTGLSKFYLVDHHYHGIQQPLVGMAQAPEGGICLFAHHAHHSLSDSCSILPSSLQVFSVIYNSKYNPSYFRWVENYSASMW